MPPAPRSRPARLRGAWLLSLGALLPLIAAPAGAQVGDSLRWRLETGGSADYTNERFYETFDDSLFRRNAVDSPERRFAGVLLTGVQGTRAGGTTAYHLVNELSVGDRLTREALGFTWRADPTPEDRLSVDPRFEYRSDRTLDRDLEEWRGSAGVRFRRSFLESFRSLDLGLRGEFVRSSGAGSEFVLGRDAGSASAALEQIGLDAPEWRIGYRFTARTFPDSGSRNHFEHSWEGRLRANPVARWIWQFETSGERRVTIDLAPTSRDNFWQERAELEVDRRGEEFWGFRGRLEAEALQYDLQDSTLYFDYETVRLTAGPRLGGAGTWSAWAATRIEALFSAWNPAEEYLETAFVLESEALVGRSWWTVSPAAGWREYGDDPGDALLAIPSLRSSYAFLEIGTFADQEVGGGMRVRLIGNSRFEFHQDDSQDASSLYFSLDVRKIF